eukprot:TRINITY_DN820_c0_g1_i8.p1 TRINITY_DN820_c0_g1~~TRINITY_DN820_c0_g1_i8.p1  ORF type:complete len:765 (+),score=215.67 TRINITY_DN820_c0_g1_i8:28-2295(+)
MPPVPAAKLRESERRSHHRSSSSSQQQAGKGAADALAATGTTGAGGGAASGSERVRVVVRCRPMSSTEMDTKCKNCIVMNNEEGSVEISSPEKTKKFNFDAVYDWNSTQNEIYTESAAPIVNSIFDGYNGTIFAYGQTGSGKTWTMEGKPTSELQGVMPNAFEHIFNKISLSQKSTQYLVRASYVEIYNEDVCDLLGDDHKKKLEVRQIFTDGGTEFYPEGRREVDVENADQLTELLHKGSSVRHVGSHKLNQHSSRSHAIFTLILESSTPSPSPGGKPIVRQAVLNLVDLAGSEKQMKTGAEGERLKEGAKINKSLSALSKVISALTSTKENTHVPYRDSRLTKLLMHSLGGSCRTVMITNISPADYNFQESLTSLRYAERAKLIKNTPHMNTDPKNAKILEYQETIARLKEMLAKRAAGGMMSPPPGVDISSAPELDIDSEKQLLEKEKQDEIAKITSEKSATVECVKTMRNDLKSSSRTVTKQMQEKEELMKQLQQLENKLGGSGAQQLQNENQQQKALLQQHAIEIQAKEVEERKLRRQLKHQREKAELLVEKYSDLQKSKEIVTRKLKELKDGYLQAEQEIKDVQDEANTESEELRENISLQRKKLHLFTIIANSFINPDEVQRLIDRSVWDDENKRWTLKPILEAPPPADSEKRLDSGRLSGRSGSGKHKVEADFLELELDTHDRITRDYQEPTTSLAPEVEATMKQLQQESASLISSEVLPSLGSQSPLGRTCAQRSSSFTRSATRFF